MGLLRPESTDMEKIRNTLSLHPFIQGTTLLHFFGTKVLYLLPTGLNIRKILWNKVKI